MNKMIKTSVLALATSFAATGLFAEELADIGNTESATKTTNEYMVDRAAGYIVFDEKLSHKTNGSGVAVDVRALADNFAPMEGVFGKYQDNIYFTANARYYSGDSSDVIMSTTTRSEDVSYLSMTGGAGYMHHAIQNGSIDLKAFFGLGLGYSTYSYEKTVSSSFSGTTTTTNNDDKGVHIHYSTGLILGLKNFPEAQLEVGLQSMAKGYIRDEYYVRADYDLTKKLDLPLSVSGRFNASDSTFALGAVYHF